MVIGLLPVQSRLNPAGGGVVGVYGKDQIRDKYGSLEARKRGPGSEALIIDLLPLII